MSGGEWGSNSSSAVLMALCTRNRVRVRRLPPPPHTHTQGHQEADIWPQQVKGDDPRRAAYQAEPKWRERETDICLEGIRNLGS